MVKVNQNKRIKRHFGQLRALGDHLVDVHGPHDHQMLFAEDQHLNILDQLVNFKGLKEDYAKFSLYTRTSPPAAGIAGLGQTRSRDLDLLTHQVRKLELLPLAEEKYEALFAGTGKGQ